MKTRTEEANLPRDLLELFEQARPLSKADLKQLETAAKSLDDDPTFRAELLKGLFVEQIREAMDDAGISQSLLARRWGKSRQYLSKVLSEDDRINFTIETMVELAHHVGRKMDVLLLNPEENTHVLTCKVTPRQVASVGKGPDPVTHPVPIDRRSDFLASKPFTGGVKDAARLSA